MSNTSSVPRKDDATVNDNSKDDPIGFCVLLLIFSLIVGIGLICKAGHDYDMAHPYIPFTFQVDFLEVTSITFSRPNTSITSNQSDDKQFSLNITVNTKEAKFFRTLQVTVEYDDQLVSNTTIAPFHQDALSENKIPLQMGMADTRLPNKVIDSISRKLASEGALDFTVIVRGNNWGVYPHWGTGYTCDMKMVCEGIRVTVSSTNNTWNGSTKDCPFPCKYSTKGCDDD